MWIVFILFLVFPKFSQPQNIFVRPEDGRKYCWATDAVGERTYNRVCENADINHQGAVEPAPSWEMRNPLPGELRVRVFIREYYKPENCPFSDQWCRVLQGKKEEMLWLTTDLMARMRKAGESSWSDAGLVWRIGSFAKSENSFTNLPGFSHLESDKNYIFRYFYDYSGREPLLHHTDVEVELKTRCYQIPDGIGDTNYCKGICEGYSTGSAWHKILDPHPSQPPLEFEPVEGFFRARLKRENDKYYIEYKFKRVSENPKPGKVHEMRTHYHFILYENSKSESAFKPIIELNTVKLNDFQNDMVSFDISDKWGQINLLLKATNSPVKYPSWDNINDCKSFDGSFLGDIYPDWAAKKGVNLAVAVSLCYHYPTKFYICTKWNINTAIVWDKTIEFDKNGNYVDPKEKKEPTTTTPIPETDKIAAGVSVNWGIFPA